MRARYSLRLALWPRSQREAEPAQSALLDAAADAAAVVHVLRVPIGNADRAQSVQLGSAHAPALRRTRQLSFTTSLGRNLGNVRYHAFDEHGRGARLDDRGARAGLALGSPRTLCGFRAQRGVQRVRGVV